MQRNKLIPVIMVLLIFSCTKKSEGLKQEDMPSFINRFMLIHVNCHNIDNAMSERILNNYINILDYGKYYFYENDIKKFSKYNMTIDNLLANYDYGFIFEIFSTYKKRFNESMLLFDKLLEHKYDFNKDEKIIVDRDDVAYATSVNEMRDRWRKNIKLQLLNYMSTGKKVEEAKKKLRKKYGLVKKRVDEIDREKLLAKFMNAISTAMDPHSNYLTKEEHEDLKISMELKLEGIGVRLTTEDGFVKVEGIIPGGATDKLPKDFTLKPNDKIVAVAQKDGEPVDVIDMDLRDVVKKIRGKKGTEVRLTVLRETENGGKTERFILPIIREEINLQDSDAESDIFELPGGNSKIKIGYIKLPSFYEDEGRRKSASSDLRFHILQLRKKGVEGIILDLRNNPGGLLTEATRVAGHFIETGPVVQIKSGEKNPEILRDTNPELLYGGPLVVLINKLSASASEILAGAIKDYRRGVIIGPSSTFGKGTVQNVIPIPSFPPSVRGEKGAIKVTTHIFYQPAGTSNQLNGIEPDIVVPSITSIWDIGEDKTRYPLKWQPIKPAAFKKWKNLNSEIIASLSRKSKARIKNDKKFIELQKKISKYRKRLKDKAISLKEEASIEKQKKKEIEKTIKKDRSRKTIDLENDLLLSESFKITGDYIKLLKKSRIAR